jgi:DNA-binding transcriptional ArsR family regulator
MAGSIFPERDQKHDGASEGSVSSRPRLENQPRRDSVPSILVASRETPAPRTSENRRGCCKGNIMGNDPVGQSHEAPPASQETSSSSRNWPFSGPVLTPAPTTIFSLIDNRTALRVFWALTQQPLSVEAVSNCVGASRTSVSHHLSVLLRAGFVSQSKRGRERLYYSSPERFLRAIRALKKLCELKDETAPTSDASSSP